VTGPLLRTRRLELWQPVAGDLPGLHALTSDAETRRFLGSQAPSAMGSGHRLLRAAGSWALYGYGSFLVRLAGDERIVGHCGVFHSWRGFGQGLDDMPEAGWIIHRDHWRQGLAREAMEAALGWFDATHGQQRVACMIEEGHVASDHLARSLGFTLYGRHQPEQGAALLLYERI